MPPSFYLFSWENGKNVNIIRKNCTQGGRNLKSQGFNKPMNPKIRIDVNGGVGIINSCECNATIGTVMVSVLNDRVSYSLIGRTKFLYSDPSDRIKELKIMFLEKNSSIGNTILGFKKQDIFSLENKLVFFFHRNDFSSGIEFMTTSSFVFTKQTEDNPKNPSDFYIDVDACMEFYRDNVDSDLYTYQNQEYRQGSSIIQPNISPSYEEETMESGRPFLYEDTEFTNPFFAEDNTYFIQNLGPTGNFQQRFSYQQIESFPPLPIVQTQYQQQQSKSELFNVSVFLDYVRNPSLLNDFCSTQEQKVARTIDGLVKKNTPFTTNMSLLERMNKIMNIDMEIE